MFTAIKRFFLKRQYKAVFKDCGIEVDPQLFKAFSLMKADEIAYERLCMKEGLTKKVTKILADESEETEDQRRGLAQLLGEFRTEWLTNREAKQSTDFNKFHRVINTFLEEV